MDKNKLIVAGGIVSLLGAAYYIHSLRDEKSAYTPTPTSTPTNHINIPHIQPPSIHQDRVHKGINIGVDLISKISTLGLGLAQQIKTIKSAK